MNPVRIASLELFAVDLPLRSSFKHAAAERSLSESVFLKCVTDTGAVGFGGGMTSVSPGENSRPASGWRPSAASS